MRSLEICMNSWALNFSCKREIPLSSLLVIYIFMQRILLLSVAVTCGATAGKTDISAVTSGVGIQCTPFRNIFNWLKKKKAKRLAMDEALRLFNEHRRALAVVDTPHQINLPAQVSSDAIGGKHVLTVDTSVLLQLPVSPVKRVVKAPLSIEIGKDEYVSVGTPSVTASVTPAKSWSSSAFASFLSSLKHPEPSKLFLSSHSGEGGGVRRVRVKFARSETKTYSFLFDTASALDMVSATGSSYPNPSDEPLTDADISLASREDFAFVPGVIEESISLLLGGEADFLFSTRLALISPQTDSVIGDGVFAANRDSRFVEMVGSFILAPPGLIAFGKAAKLADFCTPKGTIVSAPLISYSRGDWAIEATLAIEGLVASVKATFLIQSTVQKIVLPAKIYTAYFAVLKEYGLAVQYRGGKHVLRNFRHQLSYKGITALPALVLHVGGALTAQKVVRLEIPAIQFVSVHPHTGTGTFNLIPAIAAGLDPHEGVLGTKFLNAVTVQFDHQQSTLSMCLARRPEQ